MIKPYLLILFQLLMHLSVLAQVKKFSDMPDTDYEFPYKLINENFSLIEEYEIEGDDTLKNIAAYYENGLMIRKVLFRSENSTIVTSKNIFYEWRMGNLNKMTIINAHNDTIEYSYIYKFPEIQEYEKRHGKIILLSTNYYNPDSTLSVVKRYHTDGTIYSNIIYNYNSSNATVSHKLYNDRNELQSEVVYYMIDSFNVLEYFIDRQNMEFKILESELLESNDTLADYNENKEILNHYRSGLEYFSKKRMNDKSEILQKFIIERNKFTTINYFRKLPDLTIKELNYGICEKKYWIYKYYE